MPSLPAKRKILLILAKKTLEKRKLHSSCSEFPMKTPFPMKTAASLRYPVNDCISAHTPQRWYGKKTRINSVSWKTSQSLTLEPLWPAFSRIQSKCGKIRTRVTPNTDNFYAVWGNRRLHPTDSKDFHKCGKKLLSSKYLVDCIVSCFLET